MDAPPTSPRGSGAAIRRTAPRDRIPHERGDKTHGEESCKGREEEGRQEALSCRVPPKTGAIVAPVFACTEAAELAEAAEAAEAAELFQFFPIPDPHLLNHVELL